MPGETQQSATWEQWQQGWRSQANQLNWALRNFLSWTPVAYRENPAGCLQPEQFSSQDLGHAESLIDRYGLSGLPKRASHQRVLETLTYLDWLDVIAQAAPDWLAGVAPQNKPNQPLRWLDVGAKNWAYVEALSGFTRARHGENFELDGIELDPHRRYTNGQTRAQAAQSFIQHVPQAAYHAGDVQQWQQPAEIISLFLPFVFEEPLLAWGLPLRYFQPQTLLNHVLKLLPPGGLLIVVNQDEAEAEAQARLFQTASASYPLQIKKLGELPARFMNYQYPRLGWLCQKAFP